MTPTEALNKSLAIIRERVPNFSSKLGMILGSGVSKLVNEIQHAHVIPYKDLPAMRECQVPGHAGLLYLGSIKDQPIVCFQGRNHPYEGHPQQVIQASIRLLKLLGVETVILVSAVGSLSAEKQPGDLVALTDHMNFQFNNPLVGPNEEEWGPRFPGMENAYDADLRNRLKNIAKGLEITLHEGVYVGVLGPSYETPAEIRAFKLLGADVVGMSTVPEVILARHCGIKVLAIGVVTNMAAGLSQELLDHKNVLIKAEHAIQDLSRLLPSFIEQIS